MAGRTSENKWARRWGPHEPQQGSRRTNRSQHVGPFLLLRANMRVGAAQTLHMTVVVGAHWGATWAPEVHTRAHGRGEDLHFNLLSPRLCVSSPAKVVHSASQFTRTYVESFFLFSLYIRTCPP